MELWLLRHAKADSFSETGRDQDRPLAPAGEAMCQRLNAWLRTHIEHHPKPRTIRFSPALRTTQTIEWVTQGLALPAPRPLDDLWAASTGDLVEIIQTLADAPGPIWLIGHNPGLSDVVAWLACPLPPPGMKPGTLVRLNVTLPLQPRAGEIIEVVQLGAQI